MGGSLTVHVPCVLSTPIQTVVAAYQSARPGIEVVTEVDKPLAMLSAVRDDPGSAAVVITMGDVEMESLVDAGAVAAEDVRTVARNTYPLAIVAPRDTEGEGLHSLAQPGIERVFIEDPKRSSLGDRLEQALSELGLWDEVAQKSVRPEPDVMLLAQMLDGGADAAVVFKDCLFAEGRAGGSAPATIRVIADLPEGVYDPIPYQAAPLRTEARVDVARDFVEFLLSDQGKQALRSAGLTPAD